MQDHLPPIPLDANKYTRGSLLVLAGSFRYPGAAVLASLAGARAGAGYVTLAVPGRIAATCAHAHLLSVPVIQAKESVADSGVFAADAFSAISNIQKHCNAIIIGPGITACHSTAGFVSNVLYAASDARIPVLLDADALNVLCVTHSDSTHDTSSAQTLAEASKNARSALLNSTSDIVLTPHAGELKRLLSAFDASDADDLANKIHAVLVAKGPTTHIVDGRDGKRHSINIAEGTPALAKAGTGDVLAGIISSLMAQGMDAYDAACMGVRIHSHAGVMVANRSGVRALMAEDLIKTIPKAMLQYELT
jgi:NAD(P)H-hydrate epimerase